MVSYPATLIFRQYGSNGRPLPSGYVVEREAWDDTEKDSVIAELKALDYELEAIVSTADLEESDDF